MIRNSACSFALLLVAGLGVQAWAADEQKKDGSKSSTPSKQEYALLVQAGEAVGKLVNVDPAGKTFTLEIGYQMLEPKEGDALQGALAQQQQILQQQQQALLVRDPIQRQRRLAQIVQRQATNGNSAFRTVTEHKDFDLQGTDDIKVRLAEPAAKFDDKGFPVKYSPKELQELQGKLPGYSGTLDNLKNGQSIKVIFSKKQPKPAKDADKNAIDKPTVAMIMVLADPTDNSPDKDKRDDKKKK